MKRQLLLSLFLLGFGASVDASDPCVERVRAFSEQLGGMDQAKAWPIVSQALNSPAGCILGDEDSSELRRHVDAMLPTDATPEQIGNARGLLLDVLLEHFDGLDQADCAGPEIHCVAGRHDKQVRRLVQQIREGRFQPRQGLRNEWAYQTSGEVAVSYVELRPMIGNACAGGLDATCIDAVEVAAKVARTSKAVNEVFTSLYAPYIEASDQFLTLRDKEWKAYLNGASVQFPWELAINGALYREPNQSGFPQPPAEQLVVLHPSVGVESIEGADGNRQQAAAILVEVLGYQRWRWSEGEQQQRWGISATVSLADIDGMDKVGFGALVHTPMRNTAIGVVWRDGDGGSEIGITLNLDLAKLLQTHGSDAVQRFIGSETSP